MALSDTPKQAGGRLAFLDWARGLAAIIMLQGHAFHAFTKPEFRDGGAYTLSQFVGGMPPAIFLFLLGVTLSFLMDSRERQGVAAAGRVWSALRRSGYLLAVAFAFRLQLWLFGLPDSNWRDLFRVDILNMMGFSVIALSVMAVFPAADRVRFCAAVGLAIAALSPLVSQMNWSGVPPFLKAYIAPDYQAFSFFPWAAFVAFGMSAGSIIRLTPAEHLERTMQWSALLGFGLIVSGNYFSNFSPTVYAKSEFWLDSPWLTLIKLGVILVLLPLAFLWTRHATGQKWSWVRQFGTTSLLVYWFHIELIYGRWLWFWKENLTPGKTAIAAVGLILFMLAVSTLRTHWKNWRLIGVSLGWYNFLNARKAE